MKNTSYCVLHANVPTVSRYQSLSKLRTWAFYCLAIHRKMHVLVRFMKILFHWSMLYQIFWVTFLCKTSNVSIIQFWIEIIIIMHQKMLEMNLRNVRSWWTVSQTKIKKQQSRMTNGYPEIVTWPNRMFTWLKDCVGGLFSCDENICSACAVEVKSFEMDDRKSSSSDVSHSERFRTKLRVLACIKMKSNLRFGIINKFLCLLVLSGLEMTNQNEL